MQMSRRRFLSAGAAFSTMWMLGGLAGTLGMVGVGGCAAAAPRASHVAPGVTRVDLGAVRLTMLSDGFGARALDANFVRNAPLADVQAALREAGLPTDKLTIPYSIPLVDLGGERVLFDVGNGEFGAASAGKLLENLASAGVDPASITAIVFSHFHGDHINGLRNKAGALVFPNAKLYVPEPEWAWWMDDARMAAAPEAMKNAFAATRRVFSPLAGTVRRFTPGETVLPGIRSLPAFGHTPGHTAFLVEGGTRTLLFWADATNIAALFVRNPDWAVAFDMDAEKARQVRRQLSDMAIREGWLVAGYHLPGSAVGTLARRGSGYEFTPFTPLGG